jgi:hypothetical protein
VTDMPPPLQALQALQAMGVLASTVTATLIPSPARVPGGVHSYRTYYYHVEGLAPNASVLIWSAAGGAVCPFPDTPVVVRPVKVHDTHHTLHVQ